MNDRTGRRTRGLGIVAAGLLAGAALTLAAMGSVSAQTYPAPMATPTSTATPSGSVAGASAAPSTIQLGMGTTAALGSFLTGPDGRTLYTLSSDPDNGSICTGQCLTFWPPLLVAAGGTTTLPLGTTGAVGTFTRTDDGTTQVTYKSRALYYFKNDTAAGQTNGEGIQALGGVWHVAKVDVATTAPSSVKLGTRSTSALGTFLTGPNGMTLYTLSSDPDNGTVCFGQCVTFWPLLEVAPGGSVTAPAGVSGRFSTFLRSDGPTQVTFNGRALYYFKNDTAPGQTNGEGIKNTGGVWHVAAAAVAAATATPAPRSTPPATSTGSAAGGTNNTLPLAMLVAAGAGLGLLARRTRQASVAVRNRRR